jgi:O-succinylbenzoic acid--CoA ligase
MTLTSGVDRSAEGGGAYASAHLASAAGVLALMPFAAEDDWLLSLPLFHVSGQGYLALAAGRRAADGAR